MSTAALHIIPNTQQKSVFTHRTTIVIAHVCGSLTLSIIAVICFALTVLKIGNMSASTETTPPYTQVASNTTHVVVYTPPVQSENYAYSAISTDVALISLGLVGFCISFVLAIITGMYAHVYRNKLKRVTVDA